MFYYHLKLSIRFELNGKMYYGKTKFEWGEHKY